MTTEHSAAGSAAAHNAYKAFARPAWDPRPGPRDGLSPVQLIAYEQARRCEEEARASLPPPPPPEFSLPDDAVAERANMIEMLTNVLGLELICRERYLALATWPAYSFMGPLERTELFAKHYQDAFTREFGRSSEVSADPTSVNFAVVWQMRQSADREGLPYDIYCRLGMHFYKAPRYFEELKSGSLRIPGRVGKPSWFKRKQKLWPELEAGSLSNATLVPQYHAEHFREFPAQIRFRNRLIAYAKETRSSEWVASIAFLQRYIMPIGELLTRLGLESEDKKQIVESLRWKMGFFEIRPPAETLPPEAFMQGCFGWFTGSSDHCVRCPLRTQCSTLATKVNL